VHDTDIETAKDKVDKAEQLVFEVGRRGIGNYFASISNLTSEFFKDVDSVYETKKPITGLKVGFMDLDEVTAGFNPGDFIVIGARPAMGKTSLVLDFALNVARDLARHQKRGSVAIFSLEMGGIQLAQRMVSSLSGISMRILRQDKELTESEYLRLSEACDDLYGLPIFIDDNADLNPLELRGKCRRLKAEHGLSLVVIDYLQLMRGSRRTDNRVNEISEIARACKRMAKELGVPVIALSQLSRTLMNREDKRPQLSDLRDSGSIEAEADMVLLLHRQSYYDAKAEKRREVEDPNDVQEAEVDVAKNRNGPTRKVKIGFQPAYSRFRNLAHDYDIDE
jgi:replicative DNA helicase